MGKNALCIGINDYPGTDMDLAGCVNDANDWAAVLEARGFVVTTLLDAKATKAAMVKAMSTLIGGAKTGDSLVITFSGHGSVAPDHDSDEADGWDEALAPHDIAQGRPLLDDEIAKLFGARAAGVRLVLISDSCHSGTVTRAAPAAKNSTAPRARFLPPAAWLPKDAMPKGANGKPLASIKVKASASPLAVAMSPGDLLLSGCQEGPDNFSYDATFDGRSSGAFTYCALKALKGLKATATYAQWHEAVRKSLPSLNYPQTPQIVGTKTARKVKVLS
jgi:hypothetical protein